MFQGSAAEHGQFVLVLRSAVCHLGGESVSKGHYVAYTADLSAGGDETARSETDIFDRSATAPILTKT